MKTITKCTTQTLGAIALAAAFSAPALAEDDMSYSYIEGAYINTEIDDGLNVDGDGFGVSGSIELGEIAFLTAGYAGQEFDHNVDLDQWGLGIGGHLPLMDNLDVVGTLSYVNAEVDTRFGSVDDDGFGAGIGLRAHLADQFEVEGGINYVDLDDTGDDTSLTLGGRYYISPELAVGAGVEFGDDVTSWKLGVRVEF